LINNGTVEFYQVSDSRLKENIKKSGMNALNTLNAIEVVDYNFIKAPGATHTGYIAQDVQKIRPGMVIYNDRNDTYAISTASLIPVLHKAILEQQQQIEAQAKKIEELELLVRQLAGK